VSLTFQALINGILLGGVYALYSAGFCLIFGVMGVVNIAHGELVMLGAFATYWLFLLGHLDPLISLPVSFALLFCFGYILQRLLINRVVGAPPIMSYILTFGIHLVIANVALLAWTADFRTFSVPWAGTGFAWGSVVIPKARLVTFLLAGLVVGLLYFLLSRTRAGRAIRATAQDWEMARLVGINVKAVYALTFALGAGITGVAGSMISTFFVIYPQMGLQYTIVAFCVAVLGGMGYLPGALLGGLLLGVVESLCAALLSPGLSVAVTFFILFLVLLMRPRGLLGRGMLE
jgi:branched-chain amino acid transport system permease protein